MPPEKDTFRQRRSAATVALALSSLLLSPLATRAAPPAPELHPSALPSSLSEARQALLSLVPDAERLSAHRRRDPRRVRKISEVPGAPMVCVRTPANNYGSLFQRRRCMTIAEFQRERRLALLRSEAFLGMPTDGLLVTTR